MERTSGCFKSGFDKRRRIWSEEDRQKAISAKKRKREELYETVTWLELPKDEKRRRILKEQEGKCLCCQLSEWQGQKITLELDHIDGNHSNDVRENVRYLCPNCHSQTPTWRRKK